MCGGSAEISFSHSDCFEAYYRATEEAQSDIVILISEGKVVMGF